MLKTARFPDYMIQVKRKFIFKAFVIRMYAQHFNLSLFFFFLIQFGLLHIVSRWSHFSFLLCFSPFSLCLSLSINPAAVGVVALVFPFSDKALYGRNQRGGGVLMCRKPKNTKTQPCQHTDTKKVLILVLILA